MDARSKNGLERRLMEHGIFFLENLSKQTKDIIWTGDFARERAFLDIYIHCTKSINLSVAKIRLDEWFPS